ncbi:MAG TPA: CBS domain-containing protein, partial [Desulfobulbus sp.]|nr:CBS domain-containing protein [Desulfobulbus sp.]
RGIRFAQGRDMDIMQGVMVGEVMNRNPVTIRRDQTLAELYQRFQETNFLGFPVLDEEGLLWGIVTLQDMEKALSQSAINLRGLQVDDVAVPDPVTVYPDEPIWAAIQKMAPRDLARLPVVSRGEKRKLLGLISRSDILRAYDVGIVRKQRGQLLESHVTLRRQEYNGFREFRLRKGQRAVGALLRDLDLPEAVNVVSVERNGMVLIPRGGTRFEDGDIVTVFGRKDSLRQAQEVFTASGEGPGEG